MQVFVGVQVRPASPGRGGGVDPRRRCPVVDRRGIARGAEHARLRRRTDESSGERPVPGVRWC